MASGSSSDRNGSVGRNDCGIAAETETVAEVAMLAVAGASNNKQNSGGSVNGGSGQQSTERQRQC
jgi:hypothetical protein